MNIIRRRYDVILKLTIMLALIGCFFIAGGRDVKATAAGVANFVIQNNGDLQYNKTYDTETATLRFYIKDAIDSNNKIGDDIIIDSAVTNAVLPASDILKAIARTEQNGSTISIYYTLQPSSGTEGTITDTNVDAKEVVRAMTSDNGYLKNTSSETIAKITLSSSSDNAVPNSNNSIMYCYKFANVTVNYATEDKNDEYAFWKLWSPDGTTTAPYSGKTETTIESSAITADETKYIPVYKKIISNLNLDTPDSTYEEYEVIKAGQSKTHTLKKNPTDSDIPINAAGNVIHSVVPTDAAEVSYNTTTEKLTVTPFSNYIGTFKVVLKVKNGVGPGENDYKEQEFYFTSSKALTGVTISAPTEGYKDTAMTLTATPNTGASVSNYSWEVSSDNGATWTGISGNTATVTYTPTTTGSYKFRVTAKDASDNTNTKGATTSTITVIDNTLTKLQFTPNSYGVTVGYSIKATIKATPTSAFSGTQRVTVTSASESKASVTDISDPDSTNTYIYATIKGVTAADSVTIKASPNPTVTGVKDATATVKVYASPADSSAFKYTESSRILQGKSLPSKVLVGNASYDIDKVTGFKIYVMKGSEQLGTITYKDNKDKGTTGESSASDLENIIKNNTGKFSGETDTIKLRAVAIGTYGGSSEIREAKDNSGNLLAWEKDVTVYHMVAKTSDGIDYATVDTSYALEGQSVTFTATVASDRTFQKWVQGTSTTGNSTYTTAESKIPAKTSGNTYTAVAGVRSSSSGSTDDGTGGLDEVPKTSESNMPFIFIIFSVFAVIGTGYALYMTLRPARSSGTDDTDDYDNYDE